MQFDTSTGSSWKFGHRGRVAVFIDGNNLFHAARFHTIDIDYNKLLRILLGDGRLLRAFFYTGVDAGAERQQGFLLWMRRNGFRVVQKELKTFYDGTRKANLDVEIAVDMLSLAGRYDTAVLVSGDEDFVYAVNAVAYKGCRVEVAGFRSNTAPRLIDVADFFIDLGEIAELIRKDGSLQEDYEVGSFISSQDMPVPDIIRGQSREPLVRGVRTPPIDSVFSDDDRDDITGFRHPNGDR
ncbi:MAG: NYN domain-containing protein [Blastocatellia bacterium]|nr:NYN domain-containing protein [Chloracidobacterium sp.]MBL8183575.1 NYN domain-containing protein [Blastocatellia bacterium]HRJ87378.1 NYN domain-containing protein [Pyrinomonadaceae bacterium]HRK49887.1 NYN domain-containing protein [Pyrinomonadaceae bacterium]